MDERINHNEIIKSDLEDAGFDVRWNLNDGLIISMNRKTLTSEVQMALVLAGYDEGQFKAYGNGRWVIVDAVC